MPVQKGKRHKRPRSRGHQTDGAVAASPVAPKSEPVRRSRRRTPTWMKAGIGTLMLVAGLFFFISDSNSVGMRDRILLFVIYLVLAALYLGSAAREYLSKRAQSSSATDAQP